MIHRLNEQVLDSPDSALPRDRKQDVTQLLNSSNKVVDEIQFRSKRLSSATSTLRSLVEDNAKEPTAVQLPAGSIRSLPGKRTVSEEANKVDDGDDYDTDSSGTQPDNRAPKRAKII